MQHQCFEHPLGSFALVADQDRLISILWRENPAQVASVLNIRYAESREKSSAFLTGAWAAVTAFLAGESRQMDLPHELRNVTPFQKRVLQILQDCPYGTTLTYGELARQVGSPHAARAIGAAMAANPLPLLIPCHRVVGSGHKLTGYSGGRGISTKKYLLALEAGDRP